VVAPSAPPGRRRDPDPAGDGAPAAVAPAPAFHAAAAPAVLLLLLLLLLLLVLLLMVVLRLQLLLMVLLLGRQSHITGRHCRQLVVGRHRRLLLFHKALLSGSQHGGGTNGAALRAFVLVGLLGGRVDAIDAAHKAAGQEGGRLMGQPMVFV